MERAEWLKQMRDMTEALYDHVAPEYWGNFGLYENEAHQEYLRKFIDKIDRSGSVLSAACGAGRYDGMLTVEMPDEEEVKASYERAKAMGLPVVFGELADEVAASYERVRGLDSQDVQGELEDVTVYHYYPSTEQIREWIEQAGLAIEEKGTGNGYDHYVVRRE